MTDKTVNIAMLGPELTPAQVEKILNEMELFIRLEYPRSEKPAKPLSDLESWNSLFSCEEETVVAIAPKHLLDLDTPPGSWGAFHFEFPHYEFLQAVYYYDYGNVKVHGHLLRITDKMYNELKRFLRDNFNEHVCVIETMLVYIPDLPNKQERCETESVIAYKAGGAVVAREDFEGAKRYRDEVLDEFFTWIDEAVEYYTKIRSRTRRSRKEDNHDRQDHNHNPKHR